MTATITEIEQELFEALDFEITCKPYTMECSHKAEWLCVKKCGCEFLFCDPHKAMVEEARAQDQGMQTHCAPCGLVYVHDNKYIPLGA